MVAEGLYDVAVTAYPNAVVEVGFLGGTRTTIWWVGVLGAVRRLSLGFLLVLLIQALLRLKQYAPRQRAVIGVGAVAILLASAWQGLFTGWKAPLLILVGSALFAYITYHQRLPLLTLLVISVLFVKILAPTIELARDRLIAEGLESQAYIGSEIRAAFSDVITGNDQERNSDREGREMDAPFRGVAALANAIVERDGAWTGSMDVPTVTNGLLIAVPRALFPQKPDLDFGNDFARVYGSDLDVTDVGDLVTNISPSVTFEIASNFGIIAGIVAFPILGIIWGVLITGYLGSADASAHLLAPWFSFFAWTLEGNVGFLSGGLRDFVIVGLILIIGRRIISGLRSYTVPDAP